MAGQHGAVARSEADQLSPVPVQAGNSPAPGFPYSCGKDWDSACARGIPPADIRTEGPSYREGIEK